MSLLKIYVTTSFLHHLAAIKPGLDNILVSKKYECRSAWPSEEPLKNCERNSVAINCEFVYCKRRHHYYSTRYKNRSQQCYDFSGKIYVL